MSIYAGPNYIRDGLLLYLDSGNTDSYPGSGSTWFDLSGKGNNGTIINGSSFSAGGLNFDGTNQYVNISNSAALNPGSQSFTLECVYNRTFRSGSYGGLLDSRASGLSGLLLIVDYPARGRLSFFINDTTGDQDVTYTNGAPLFDNKLYYISFTVNRQTSVSSLYVNGAFYENINIPHSNSVLGASTAYRLACDIGGLFFLGSFYSWRHYTRVLSATEIHKNFNAARTRYSL